MCAVNSAWENQLLSKARITAKQSPADPIPNDDRVLHWAYARCEEITRSHSRTFYLTSALLDPQRRLAARALYAFCRVSDDIIDRPNGDQKLELKNWRRLALADSPAGDDPVSLAWGDTRRRFGVPIKYAEQLLEGVSQDLDKTRYTSFGELAHYCYSVASTVGLMTMYIIGFTGEQAVPYAIKLGVALQLTNILRDIGEDWRNGRLYLPQDELDAFGITEDDIAAGVVTPGWRSFMRFQINRNRQLYAEAMPGINLLARQGRYAIAASAELYQLILAQIEANDYDVFQRRAYVSNLGKLKRLPGIWWRTYRDHYQLQVQKYALAE
jgi:phytoene synthase